MEGRPMQVLETTWLEGDNLEDRAEMAERFRLIMGAVNIRRKDLAALSGKNEATWTRICKGESFPEPATVQRFVRAIRDYGELHGPRSIFAAYVVESLTPEILMSRHDWAYWVTRVSTNGEHQSRRRRATDLMLVATSV
jgi:predicted transcriptional regulator